MTPPDDLLKRAKAMLAPELYSGPTLIRAYALELVAALESDRALLRRIVKAWDSDWLANEVAEDALEALIDEARARIGES